MNLEVTSVEAKRKTSFKDHSAQAKYVRSVTLNEKLDWSGGELLELRLLEKTARHFFPNLT